MLKRLDFLFPFEDVCPVCSPQTRSPNESAEGDFHAKKLQRIQVIAVYLQSPQLFEDESACGGEWNRPRT
jgi:hypothetical protein